MIEDYKSTKEVVEKILSNHPLTRSNDNYLVVKVLEELSYAYFDLAKEVYIIELSKNDIFRELPAFESIRRNRQKLQEQGKYKPPKWITDKRLEEALEMRKKIAKN